MLFIYPAIIHKEDDPSFWSGFPNLPGSQSSRDTLQEIIEGSNGAQAPYLSSFFIKSYSHS